MEIEEVKRIEEQCERNIIDQLCNVISDLNEYVESAEAVLADIHKRAEAGVYERADILEILAKSWEFSTTVRWCDRHRDTFKKILKNADKIDVEYIYQGLMKIQADDDKYWFLVDKGRYAISASHTEDDFILDTYIGYNEFWRGLRALQAAVDSLYHQAAPAAMESLVAAESAAGVADMGEFTPRVNFNEHELYELLIDYKVIQCDEAFFSECLAHANFKPLRDGCEARKALMKMRYVIKRLKALYCPEWYDQVATNLGMDKRRLSNATREHVGEEFAKKLNKTI